MYDIKNPKINEKWVYDKIMAELTRPTWWNELVGIIRSWHTIFNKL